MANTCPCDRSYVHIAGGAVELKRVEDNEVVGDGAPLDQAAGLSNPG